MTSRILLAAVITLLISLAHAADTGRSVIVLYNSKMPASKAVADYYAQKRDVPPTQVIGLPLPEKEIISRDDYNKELVAPLLQKLEQLKLMEFTARKWTNATGQERESPLVSRSDLRYAALCFGVPLKIEQ